MEELAVNPARNGDAAGFRQFLIHLPDELIGVGYGHPQLLGHFIDAHRNLICHDKNFPKSLKMQALMAGLNSILIFLIAAAPIKTVELAGEAAGTFTGMGRIAILKHREIPVTLDFMRVSAIYRFVTHKFSGQEKTPETISFRGQIEGGGEEKLDGTVQ